jgi:hypothetical protein
MSEHAHEWKPVPGEFQRYRCACGDTGYRAASGPNKGKIVPHKVPRVYGTQEMHVAESNLGERNSGHARLGKRGPGGW